LFSLLFWDCSGQDRYSALASKMVQLASIVLLVYDITSPDSVATVKQWWEEEVRDTLSTSSSTGSQKVCCVVGTKADLVLDRANTQTAHSSQPLDNDDDADETHKSPTKLVQDFVHSCSGNSNLMDEGPKAPIYFLGETSCAEVTSNSLCEKMCLLYSSNNSNNMNT